MPWFASKLKSMLHSETHSRNGTHQSTADHQRNTQGNVGEKARSSTSSSNAPTSESRKSKQILDILKTTFQLKNLKTIQDVSLQQIDGEPIDDKSYLMERIIQLASDLPVQSRTSSTLTNAFLNQLWTDLKHPPQSYLGSEYIYRKPDGSNNNILWPHLGSAGQPYARTVRPRLIQPVARPDPGLIYDTLLVRKDFRPHPNRISSVLFYLASIIIHDIFHTNHDDFSISDTSSYLDLAPLYGSSADDQLAVRTMCNGKLKPDCFSDVRILGFPPGVGALLIFFSRFHNHVAENLARIDEGGRFSRILEPPKRPKPARAEKLYDEALFQTARLITCGLYINIILKDYVRTILNLNRTDTSWNLDPRPEEGSVVFGHKIPEATGNSVSAEFNLIYRWHSCISPRDEQWTKVAFEKLVGTGSSMSTGQLLHALNEWASTMSPDPIKRNFADLLRLPDGKFRDEDLASIWTASVSDVAGSYGANHVPEELRDIEILGIIQSRSWNLATLNEFREYFKLEPHKRFEDINPDPVIAEQLRRLYNHPNHVELYPGIAVEAAKEPKVPGSGLCTNFTISRAILSDAVALVRGDRFYTMDYSPANLTNWGFNEASYDLEINYGCVFYKLLLTALPNSYPQNSIFAHYPLVIPDENRIIQAKLNKAGLYDFDLPSDVRPSDADAYEAVTCVSDPLFKGDTPGLYLSRTLFDSDGLPDAAAAFYKDTISELIQSESYELAGRRYVDVVRHVFNIANAQFVSRLFLLPQYNVSELIALLSDIHGCTNARQPAQRFVNTNRDPVGRRRFLEQVQEAASRVVRDHHGLLSSSSHPLRRRGAKAIYAVSKKGLSCNEITSALIVPLAASIFVHQSRIFAECLDHVLGLGDGRSVLGNFEKTKVDDTGLSSVLSSLVDRGKLEGLLAAATAEVSLRVVLDLKKLSRAEGPMGRLRRLNEGNTTEYLNVEESAVSLYPTSMTVRWETN